VKDNIMRKAVLCKFETHGDIREILLSTGDEEIVENSPIDYYWACGKDGSGKNMLGIILMEVRDKLR
jgi:N-glycosidase YbiA